MLAADLIKSGGAIIPSVHGHGRRTFRAAVTFKRADAKARLERSGEGFRQFFRAGDDKFESTKIFRRYAAQIDLQKGRGGEQHGDLVFAHDCANTL